MGSPSLILPPTTCRLGVCRTMQWDTARTADPKGLNRCCDRCSRHHPTTKSTSQSGAEEPAGEELKGCGDPPAGAGRALWVPSPAQGSKLSPRSAPVREVSLPVGAGQASLGSMGAQGSRGWALPVSASWGFTEIHFVWKLPVAGRTEMSLSVGIVSRNQGLWQPHSQTLILLSLRRDPPQPLCF